MTITTSWIEITPGFAGYLALPPAGSGPGLVLLQEIFGVGPHIRSVAERYAREGYVTLAPDWVCELLSPATAKRDRGVKMDACAEIGVGHRWMVDVDLRVLEVFEREGPRWVRLGAFADDALLRAKPFDAIEFGLVSLFRPPVPAAR